MNVYAVIIRHPFTTSAAFWTVDASTEVEAITMVREARKGQGFARIDDEYTAALVSQGGCVCHLE